MFKAQGNKPLKPKTTNSGYWVLIILTAKLAFTPFTRINTCIQLGKHCCNAVECYVSHSTNALWYRILLVNKPSNQILGMHMHMRIDLFV